MNKVFNLTKVEDRGLTAGNRRSKRNKKLFKETRLVTGNLLSKTRGEQIMVKCSKCNKSFDENRIEGICPYCGNEDITKKEYSEWEWMAPEKRAAGKLEEKEPMLRIAEDVSIIRAWVRFFSIITVIGWVIGFIFIIGILGMISVL